MGHSGYLSGSIYFLTFWVNVASVVAYKALDLRNGGRVGEVGVLITNKNFVACVSVNSFWIRTE